MPANYLDILNETIRNNWDSPALTDFYLAEDGSEQVTSRGKHYTYGEMYAEIMRLNHLFESLGLHEGDHIAICGSNSSHWIIAYLAIAVYHAVSVTIAPSQAIEDIAHQIDFSGSKAFFIDQDLWDDLNEKSLIQITNVISLYNWEIFKRSAHSKLHVSTFDYDCQFVSVPPENIAHICFTSGSTGTSKGVMIPYRSINNNIYNLLQNYVASNNPNCFIFLPFSHAGELLCDVLQQLCRGKHLFVSRDILSTNNLFLSFKVIAPYMIFVVPKVLSVLVNEHDIRELKSIEQIVTAGAQLDSLTEIKMEEQGIPLTNEYGLTETLIISSCLPSQRRKSSVGKILKNIEVCIAPNGEILVKGENVMLGYYKDPEATAQKIDNDGWLHTGDKGYLDEDGYLYVEGRLEQDIIVLPNGENIRPDNIEALINALPEVKESIVLARDGKLVARVVVPSSLPFREESEVGSLRRMILRQVNPQLPLFSQLYDIEITDQPLQRTEKQTIKRYLYK